MWRASKCLGNLDSPVTFWDQHTDFHSYHLEPSSYMEPTGQPKLLVSLWKLDQLQLTRHLLGNSTLASKFSELCSPQVIGGPSSVWFLILVYKHWFFKAFDFDLSVVLSKDLLVLWTQSQPWLLRDRCSICHFPQYKGHFCSQDFSQSTGSQHQPQVWISIWKGLNICY